MQEQFPQEDDIQEGDIWEGPLDDNGAELPRFAARPPAGKKKKKIIVGALGAGLLALSVAGVGIGVAHANGASVPGLGLVASHNGGPGGSGDGHGPGRGPGGDLTVTGVSGQTITAKQRDGTAVTIKTTSSTVFSRAGKTVSLSAVSSGENVHVQGTKNSDGSITATRVDIELPGYRGQVTAVSGSTITVKDRNGTTYTIKTTSSTSFEMAGQSASLSDVKTGEQMSAEGTLNSDNSLNAETVQIELPGYRGQVTAVSGSTITVQDHGGTHTIQTTSSTKFTRGGQSASLSDVKTGDQIDAEGTLNSDGSLAAQVVQIELPHVDGQITKISGTIITIQERNGTAYTIKVSSSTTFTDDQTQNKLSLGDLKVGEEIHAEGTQNSDGSLAAISVVVGQNSPGDGGPDGDFGGSQSWNH